MSDESISDADLDKFQASYKSAVKAWIVAIEAELALTSLDHSVAEIDRWEAAHFDEEKARNVALEAKKSYEDALRLRFFNF